MNSGDISEDSDDTEDFKDNSEEMAYSLFDDFKSTDATEVYEHMEKKFNFKYNLLGNTTLHRIVLIKYLQDKKDNNENVLEYYNKLKKDPNIVLNNFEEYIKSPVNNQKLIWGFMESSDSEAEDSILSNYIHNYKHI
ncbi:uncharacterized protein TA20450 [Theileria annulata]|uniref:Uncharacterized protein n=1 Tax=Theileria annulata TaxID=5874 RepID=Q4UH67_THEAN|nr:uncharacterized protein TA20450 [Theileria annulata]CAI73572.1 hypothetical protein TA20450 [Theileria annulata]|eukprot:XP_954249.1 hypothetical protein TA20450 [Theileria annulata]